MAASIMWNFAKVYTSILSIHVPPPKKKMFLDLPLSILYSVSNFSFYVPGNVRTVSALSAGRA